MQARVEGGGASMYTGESCTYVHAYLIRMTGFFGNVSEYHLLNFGTKINRFVCTTHVVAIAPWLFLSITLCVKQRKSIKKL